MPPPSPFMPNEDPFDERPPQETRPIPPVPSRSAPARIDTRPEYIVEPPDLVLVEVLEAYPGRPISGERLVRPDGRISLGFYGEIPVAGLTIPEIKEQIVLHLRKYLSDDALGLVDYDMATGEPRRDPRTHKIVVKDPRETDRIFVNVTAYNSQACYVEGDVLLPDRFPYTGGDTVLDLIHRAGMLLPSADRGRIRLIRSFPKGSPARVLPVNYEEIVMGTDSSTNFRILPNDRLVVPTAPSVPGERISSAQPARTPDLEEQRRYQAAIQAQRIRQLRGTDRLLRSSARSSRPEPQRRPGRADRLARDQAGTSDRHDREEPAGTGGRTGRDVRTTAPHPEPAGTGPRTGRDVRTTAPHA